MKAILLFPLLSIGLISPAFGQDGPCAKMAIELFKTATGLEPSQFALSSHKYNSWAGAQEYIYVAANGAGSAYVIELFHLDGRSCFLNSMRYDGDM